jgi:hypothetical protein
MATGELQKLRHQIRVNVREARKTLKSAKGILVNTGITAALQGKPGLSIAEQRSRLEQVASTISGAQSSLDDAVEAVEDKLESASQAVADALAILKSREATPQTQDESTVDDVPEDEYEDLGDIFEEEEPFEVEEEPVKL